MKRLVLNLVLASACVPVGAAPAQTPKRHSIERLYSLPRLIGTAPKDVRWSPDSRRLAFLWNVEGSNFYDVWTVDAPSGTPERVTRMPRPATGDAAAALRAERDPGVTEFSWHPDGRRFVVGFNGDLHIAVPGEPTRAVTASAGRESAATFSPDGVTLTYLLDGDVWAQSLDASSGGANVTSLADGDRAVRSYRIAPDGNSIAFVEANRSLVPLRSIPDYLTEEPELAQVKRPYPGDPSASFRLGVVGLSGGAARYFDLGSGPMDPIFSYRWSPDSRTLLVDTSDLYVKDRRVLLVDVDSGAVVERIRERNPLNVQALWQAEWALDGKSFYFLSDRDDDTHIFRASVEPGPPASLTRGDWAVFSFTVTTGGIFFVANEGRPEERHVFALGADGSPRDLRRVSVRPGLHRPTISPDGRYAADLFSSDDTPYDLFLTEVEATGERERQVTHSPIPEFSDYAWITPRYVTFASHIDGVPLQGRLTLPPDLDRSRKHPAILGSVYSNTVRNQWGGRTAHPTWGLDQYLVQQGYILLNVDFRGSVGHGKSFRQGIRLDYGGIDVEDLHSGVKYLESLGFVDMERIGIWGSSYGGLLTAMSLFNKPGVYKAGVAGAPATNVWHALTGEKRVMMEPADEPEAYADSSAFTHAAGLEDHLMIIHGMRDRIVLFKDSVSLVERLMRLGKDVDLVALPNSGHGWDNEGLYQTRFAFRKLIDHFERYLGIGPTPVER